MQKKNAANQSIHFGKLPGYLGYQLRRAQTAVFRDFATITRELGVSPGEFSLLTMVQANPGINQVTLARLYQIDKSTLSQSVTSLEKRELLERTRSHEDRRHYALQLTARGSAVLARVTARVEQQEALMDSVLGPGEREALLDMLGRLVGAFGD